MLKKRAKASHALESRRLMCTKLDTGSEVLSNVRRTCFAPKLRPGVQFGREALRSENTESFKTPLSEEL
jgi:hypothetical protein